MSDEQCLAADTDAETERRQVAAWRAMSPAQKAATVSGLTTAAFAMARAGVRHRFPDAGPREQFLRLAILTLGADLAVRAYPDAAGLAHPPEDILLQKLRWFRLGGEVSDRQWRDVLGIVRVQGARLDVEYLRRQAPVLAVQDLLERALAPETA